MLLFLDIALVVVVIIAWFAILVTGRYPKGMLGFVEGVIRWHNRVIAYAFVLVTDRYPPFRLAQWKGDPRKEPEIATSGAAGSTIDRLLHCFFDR